MALDRYGRATRFLTTQLMWSVLGIAMLTLVMRIDYRHYRKPTFIWTGLAVVAFALVCVYFRAPVNGARRWFGVGGIGVQPSELAKLVAIFFIAALLERRMHRINELGYALVPIGCAVAILVGLILGGRAAAGLTNLYAGALTTFLILFGSGISPLPTTTAESFTTRISYVLLAVGYTLCMMALLWPRERSGSTQLSLRFSGRAAARPRGSPASPLP
jgi:cell division protein FtsW (lipid II flippase)